MMCKDIQHVLMLLFIITCKVKLLYGIDITIVAMVIEGTEPFHLGRSGPAMDIAMEKIPAMIPSDVNLTFIRRTFPADSCKNRVAAIAAEIYYTSNVTVFIGPGCSLAVDIVGRMAHDWNLPIISPVATNGELDNKKNFGTLTRLAYTMTDWANIYIELFKEYHWEDIAIIHDTNQVFFTIVGTILDESLNKIGLRAYRQFYDSTQPYDMEDMLRKASHRSRVILIAVTGNDLRKILLLAQHLGMTYGEYVFLSSHVDDGSYSWKRGDNLDAKAKQAYESLLFSTPRRPDTDDFLAFEDEVKLRAKRDYNYTYGDAEVNVFVTAYHDAFIVYASALNETLVRGGNYRDGRFMNSKIWGKLFTGISGVIAIDTRGDREMDFSLLDLDPASGQYIVVANYFGSVRKVIFSNESTIHWPNNAGPPLNIPVCGFYGEAEVCQKIELPVEVIVTGVVGGAFFVFLIITLLVYRKSKLESDLQNKWWKVKWTELESAFPSSSAKLSRQSMLHSELTGSRTDESVPKNTATLKGIKVVIKTLQVTDIKIERKELLELMNMRDIPCSNLTRFYGMCVDEGHICTLWEHCSRGSLQDMLHNDSIKLDKTFKLSLMNDIIAGMAYIHGSPLECHGRLNSSACLIDGRFVLKITDFGLPAVRSQASVPYDFNKQLLLYVAPEHLNSVPYLNASQAGDVYSFSIVLYELLTRMEPYEHALHTDNISDCFDKIKKAFCPLRPQINSANIEHSLIKLMEDCWTANLEERPSFNTINRLTKEMFQTTASKNILDTLLQRMEQYANNLEGLVEDRTQELLDEKRKSEELLLAILPKSVADRLKYGQTVDPEAYQSVTIYFSDIVGFTKISAMSTPMQVIDLLNDLYTCFDQIIENFDVYKVETIGDSYMVVSGLPVRNGNEHVRQISRMSLSILESLNNFQIRHMPTKSIQARIGIHSGPVCAGVVGRKMPRYCLFGDTVNTASRMESNGEAMKIHISEDAYAYLLLFGNFVMEERGDIEIKGKGTMKTYWLLREEADKTAATA